MKCSDPYGSFTDKGTYLIHAPSTPARCENLMFNDHYLREGGRKYSWMALSFRCNKKAAMI